jgi:hypothetical protein
MAPLIASLIASGLGSLAQAVVNKGQDYVEEKLGVKLEPLLTTDEGRISLAQIELDKQELILQMALEDRKIDVDFYKTEVDDRKSAREAQAAIATNENSGWLNRNLLPILSLTVVGVCLYGLIWVDGESEVKYALVNVLTMILAYYYGSSSLAWKQQGAAAKLATAVAEKKDGA